MAIQMSANLYRFYPLLLIPCLQACSTYPLPQNFSGYDTEKIIANVRCEARDAVRAAAIYHLGKYDVKVARYQTGKELATDLQNHPEKFLDISISDLKGPAQKIFAYYKNTQISYDFSLQGVEFNSQGVNLGLSRQFGLRKDTLGFDNQADRTRDVTRAFFVWDKFEKLIKVGDEYCNSAKNLNIIYPITGSMPIADLILNYIQANKFGILAPDKSVVASQIIGTDKAPAIPQMGDTISVRTHNQ